MTDLATMRRVNDAWEKDKARIRELEAKIASWLHNGHMQTFASRERIRAEMRACLTAETGAKDG